MGAKTSIEYADSSANGMMGCLGCELWSGTTFAANPNRRSVKVRKPVRTCYAGRLIDGDGNRPGFAGNPGYPDSFGVPMMFPNRLEDALKWADLRGKKRPYRPWLDGLPRIVFLNDMGDAWTRAFAVDWMQSWMERAADSSHVYLMLTKNAKRMGEASRLMGGFPENFLPGVSITGPRSRSRIEELLFVEGGGPKWVSYSPAWEWVDLTDYLGADRSLVEWLVVEGESGGRNAIRTRPELIGKCIEIAKKEGAKFFLKQVGTALAYELDMRDRHGREMAQWPMHWRVREMPIDAAEKPGQTALF